MKTKLVILRTDIQTRKKLKTIVPILNGHSSIREWSIDLEDIDKVLRLEVHENIEQNEVIQLVRTHGFYAEDLPEQ